MTQNRKSHNHWVELVRIHLFSWVCWCVLVSRIPPWLTAPVWGGWVKMVQAQHLLQRKPIEFSPLRILGHVLLLRVQCNIVYKASKSQDGRRSRLSGGSHTWPFPIYWFFPKPNHVVFVPKHNQSKLYVVSSWQARNASPCALGRQPLCFAHHD